MAQPKLSETALQSIMHALVERFGEPIGDAIDAGEGVADERGGHPHKGSKMGNRGFGADDLDEDSAADKRRRIMLKSPMQKQVDTRARCEECGKVLTGADFKAYWDDDFSPRGFGDPTPRICIDCAENDEVLEKMDEDTKPGEVNSPTCSQCGGMMGVGLDEDVCTQCGMMGGMNESEGGGRHPGHAASCTCPDCSRPKTTDESAPPGKKGEKAVKALKKAKGVKNPYAVAWSEYNKGELDEEEMPETLDERSSGKYDVPWSCKLGRHEWGPDYSKRIRHESKPNDKTPWAHMCNATMKACKKCGKVSEMTSTCKGLITPVDDRPTTGDKSSMNDIEIDTKRDYNFGRGT